MSYSEDPRPKKKENTKYANVVERFLSHCYLAMRNAPHPEEVVKVVIESIHASKYGNHNLFRYPVGEDAKRYAEAKRKISDFELHSLAERTIS